MEGQPPTACASLCVCSSGDPVLLVLGRRGAAFTQARSGSSCQTCVGAASRTQAALLSPFSPV